MELVQTAGLDAYLAPATLIDGDDPAITAFVEAHLRDCDAAEAARRAFHFVRDDVRHSWDIQGRRVTRTATCGAPVCPPRSAISG
jgi:hypothetical protein